MRDVRNEGEQVLDAVVRQLEVDGEAETVPTVAPVLAVEFDEVAHVLLASQLRVVVAKCHS